MPDRDYPVTVCAACLTASCWHGEFYCQEYKTASTTIRMASELRRMGYEHPSHFSKKKLREIGEMANA